MHPKTEKKNSLIPNVLERNCSDVKLSNYFCFKNIDHFLLLKSQHNKDMKCRNPGSVNNSSLVDVQRE